MAQNQELRIQTGIVAPPSAGVVKIYANASGQVIVLNQNGTTGSLAGSFAQNLSQAGGASVSTGLARLNVTAVTWASGAVYGTTGTNGLGLTELLGKPTQWYKIIGSSGESYVIPAYSYV